MSQVYNTELMTQMYRSWAYGANSQHVYQLPKCFSCIGQHVYLQFVYSIITLNINYFANSKRLNSQVHKVTKVKWNNPNKFVIYRAVKNFGYLLTLLSDLKLRVRLNNNLEPFPVKLLKHYNHNEVMVQSNSNTTQGP